MIRSFRVKYGLKYILNFLYHNANKTEIQPNTEILLTKKFCEKS